MDGACAFLKPFGNNRLLDPLYPTLVSEMEKPYVSSFEELHIPRPPPFFPFGLHSV